MKKSSLYTGLCYFFVGLVCLILALIFEWRAEGLLWGFAGAGIFPGLMMMWQYYHWTRPENREEYQRRLHIEKVEMKDERKVMLRYRSGWTAYLIMTGLYCLLMLSFSFCSVMGWMMPFSKYAVIGLGILLLFQYVCGAAAFQYLSKRL